MMIEDDVAFWDSWNEDFLEAETEEEDRRLERRLAARHEADIEEMLADLDEKPAPAARRRQRKPSIHKMIADAEKSGKTVTRFTTPDGATLTFGEPGTAVPPSNNPWDAEIERLQ
jgi:hypothetical protein